MDHQCPHCGYLIKSEELLDKRQPLLKNYRICPHCEKSLVVDRKTRLRQIILLILSIILLFIFFLPSSTAKIVTAAGLIVIILYVIYTNRQMKFEKK
jgi:CXXC-20-CXXC protein